jgi:DNA-binding IclR family transcriptional regulator
VAAPVFGPDGVEGCICVTSPADRLSPEIVQKVVESVTREASYLSHLNGAGDAGNRT